MKNYQECNEENIEDMNSEIGNRIREERLRCGLSQGKLGVEIGQANGNQISKYEMGKSVPIKTLQKIAHVLDVDVTYLQTGKVATSDMPEMTCEQREYIFKLLNLPGNYQERIFGAIDNFADAERALQI